MWTQTVAPIISAGPGAGAGGGGGAGEDASGGDSEQGIIVITWREV
jgi:hypothetical protein